MQILFRASHHRRDDDSLKFVPLALTTDRRAGTEKEEDVCAHLCVNSRH